jgi:hypothetical protein
VLVAAAEGERRRRVLGATCRHWRHACLHKREALWAPFTWWAEYATASTSAAERQREHDRHVTHVLGDQAYTAAAARAAAGIGSGNGGGSGGVWDPAGAGTTWDTQLRKGTGTLVRFGSSDWERQLCSPGGRIVGLGGGALHVERAGYSC